MTSAKGSHVSRKERRQEAAYALGESNKDTDTTRMMKAEAFNGHFQI